MASLKEILLRKGDGISVPSRAETGIEKGEVYFFTPGISHSQGADYTQFCWNSPGTGTAVVEVWGASGGGGMMCCCGAAIPGNPGGYSKKTIKVNGSSFICGIAGESAELETQICCRDCSGFSEICYSGLGAAGTICAMGGRGGIALCADGGKSVFCCFVCNGYSYSWLSDSNAGPGCGTVCNHCSAVDWSARAFGGDINRTGGFSCLTLLNCNHGVGCYLMYHVKTAPGVFSEDGAVITFSSDQDTRYARGEAAAYGPFFFALSSASRHPSQGIPYMPCWYNRHLGCNVALGRNPYVPFGVPGMTSSACSGQRTIGLRGGHGAVRIQYIGS